jgi:uncharacterized protein (TIGR02145 family)
VPTDSEWTTLENFLGGQSFAGGTLKATTLWDSPNTGATDDIGFFALPGGQRLPYTYSTDLGRQGYWWTATEVDFYTSFIRWINSDSDDVNTRGEYKNWGYSVRCIKD